MSNDKVLYSSSSDFLNPIFKYWTTSSGQYGLVNIRYGATTNADTEQAIIENVAGYGKQIGKMLDAVVFLARRLGQSDEAIRQDKKIVELMTMNDDINRQKVASAKSNSLTLAQFIDSLAALKALDEASFKDVRDKLNEAIVKIG